MLKKLWAAGAKGKIALVAIFIALMCICCIFIFAIAPNAPEAETTQAADTKATEGEIATIAPLATPIPITPTVVPEPPEALRQLLEQELGKSNRELDRISSFAWYENTGLISITFTANDNLTEGYIKSGLQLDVAKLLQTVAESNTILNYRSIYIVATFSMVDVYGNTEESQVLRATYDRETLEKINWDNFLFENVYLIANKDDYFLHPAFLP